MELPDTLRKPVTGSVSVGMMSSQGTVGIRLGKKSHLRVSARQSYMNLLYKRWLKLNDNPMKYGFGDYNLTYIWHSGDKDKVWVDGYFGMDSAEIFQGSYDMGVSLDWGNYMSSVHWEHKGEELSHRHTLYSSGYRSHCLVTEKDASLTVPAFMNASGYNGGISWRDFKGTAQLVWYRAMPQAPSVKGLFSIDDPAKEIQNAGEGSLSFEYDKTFAYDWALRAGMKGILYLTPESDLSGGLAPDLSLSYDARRFGKLELSYALRQQNIFQTGLSNIGLPVEFWFLAGRHGRPQYSQNLSFLYDLDFCRGMFNLSVGLYHKWLYNQVEYKGDIFDLFLGGYDIDDHLLKGRGWNYGMNLMLHKQSGKVTGWVSYSLGRALRRFDNPDFSGYEILDKITKGQGTMEDLERMEELCYSIKEGSLCGLGQTAPNPVLSTLKYFRDEYEAHVRDKVCPAGVCKKLVKYEIVADKCKGCSLCAKKCPVGAITGEIKSPYTIDADKCVKCGVCMDTCKFGAIVKK